MCLMKKANTQELINVRKEQKENMRESKIEDDNR